jgi:hypothetical protein
MDKDKQTFLIAKKERRIKKRTVKRGITGEEVIFIFERVLDSWKTIKIYNTMIQQNPESGVDKKKVEVISSGNCKVFEKELPEERYKYYLELREKVYNFHSLCNSNS